MVAYSSVLYVSVVALLATGSLARGTENASPKDATELVRSGNQEDREHGRRMVLEERARVVQTLIDIIKSPRVKVADGWLDPGTARNIAIECIGEYRAVEAISALVPFLEPATGEVVISDRTLRLCPAAKTLVNIGRPTIPALLTVLAITGDTRKISAWQARLALYDIEGMDGGERLLKGAIAVEKDPAKSANLQANLKVFQEQMKR